MLLLQISALLLFVEVRSRGRICPLVLLGWMSVCGCFRFAPRSNLSRHIHFRCPLRTYQDLPSIVINGVVYLPSGDVPVEAMVSTAVSLLVIGYKVRIAQLALLFSPPLPPLHPHPLAHLHHDSRFFQVSIFDKLRLMKKREEDIETFFKTLSESQLKDAKVRWPY
jgi:hypothetical protein